MDAKQREDLEQLALAAIVADDAYSAVMCVRGRATPSEVGDKGATARAFSAAMNAQVVLGLLADFEELERERDEARREAAGVEERAMKARAAAVELAKRLQVEFAACPVCALPMTPAEGESFDALIQRRLEACQHRGCEQPGDCVDAATEGWRCWVMTAYPGGVAAPEPVFDPAARPIEEIAAEIAARVLAEELARVPRDLPKPGHGEGTEAERLLKALVLDAAAKMRRFVAKVERGEARSRETYGDCKVWLADAEPVLKQQEAGRPPAPEVPSCAK